MPGPAPAPVTVSTAQHAVLAALRRRSSCPQALALRAAIILGAATGERNEPLARRLGCTPKTARKWRGRWLAALPRLLAVDDEPAALAAAIAAALADAPAPAPRPPSPPSRSSRSSTSPAARPSTSAALSPLGRRVNWRTKRSPRASSPPSLPARWGDS